jgi:pyruvate/2-oxoglutarate dehydrogenase complex dihydrolipoamide acyltransferase (E2) component
VLEEAGVRIPIEMQQLGPNVASGTIIGWLKDVGDRVVRGEPLVEVETDKVTVEMEALRSGVLVEIVHGPGAEVRVGDVIGYLDDEQDRDHGKG